VCTIVDTRVYVGFNLYSSASSPDAPRISMAYPLLRGFVDPQTGEAGAKKLDLLLRRFVQDFPSKGLILAIGRFGEEGRSKSCGLFFWVSLFFT
jgi:hypothetical protein